MENRDEEQKAADMKLIRYRMRLAEGKQEETESDEEPNEVLDEDDALRQLAEYKARSLGDVKLAEKIRNHEYNGPDLVHILEKESMTDLKGLTADGQEAINMM